MLAGCRYALSWDSGSAYGSPEAERTAAGCGTKSADMLSIDTGMCHLACQLASTSSCFCLKVAPGTPRYSVVDKKHIPSAYRCVARTEPELGALERKVNFSKRVDWLKQLSKFWVVPSNLESIASQFLEQRDTKSRCFGHNMRILDSTVPYRRVACYQVWFH